MLGLLAARHSVRNIAVLVFMTAATSAEAQLISGDLVVYDEDRDITWLRQAGAGQGQMTFDQARTFAQAFTLNGEGGWRLPDTPLSTDAGCTSSFNEGDNCTESDLGHLYYTELGNSAGSLSAGGGPQNRGPFIDVDANVYWSGRQDGSGDVWVFNFFNGFQTTSNPQSLSLVWLVKDGKAAGVPIYFWRYVPWWGWLIVVAVMLPLAYVLRRALQRGTP